MDASNKKTLHQLLKEQTNDLHKQAQQIPYVANLLDNKIVKLSYLGHLRTFAIIYGTLEYQLAQIKSPEFLLFLDNYSPKLPLLLSDLDFLKAIDDKEIMPAISTALHVADNIIINSKLSPYKLLGYLYTLDGSLNGAILLKKHLLEGLHLKNDDSLSYFSALNYSFREFWTSFISKLNSELLLPEQKEDILSGAKEIFLEIMKIYELLWPIDEKNLGYHITSLNPEAGNYTISTDPLEITAAITGGMFCWDEFPYFAHRYADRGRRFTVSDSVWLLNLSKLPLEDCIKEVDWLARFLSIRGMPTYTMEIQMHALYSELALQIPEREKVYQKFLTAAEHLKNNRLALINNQIFEGSNALFENCLNEMSLEINFDNLPVKNMGKLIISSLIDEKNGIPGARASLENWLINDNNFNNNWILAVKKTMQKFEIYF